jgi:hypothetical protein
MNMHVAIISSLMLAGCGLLPAPRLPEGTYLEANGTSSALVVYGERVEVHVATPGDPQTDGQDYFYDMAGNGSLHFITASANLRQLQELDCNWHWAGDAIECRRDSGNNLRFVRASRLQALVTDEQRVWLAAAQHELAGRAAGEVNEGTRFVLARTAYPRQRGVNGQLREQAARGFCGLAADEAQAVLYVLKRMSAYHAKPVRDVFADRAGFSLADAHPEHRWSVSATERLISA